MIETDWAIAEGTARSVLGANGGVAPLREFLAGGLTRHQVAALFRRGALRRPRIGWYADPALPHDTIRAVRVGGVLGCVSAARTWGLPTPPDSSGLLHVSVADNASRLRHSRDRTWHPAVGEEEDVRLHWHERVEQVAGHRTGVIDTIVLLAFCVPFDWLVAAIDAALHVPRDAAALLDGQGLARLRAALPDRLRRACDLADGRAESPIETLLRLAMQHAGIHAVPQVWLVPWYRVDFLIDDWLVIEADGMGKFDADQYARDRERDAQLAAWGYRTLRFTYRQIVDEMPWVLEVILRVLAERAA